ncbi:sensor domain-containing diguanylate cyclase [Pararobbsia silviterrae]|uniref:Sensor domain-containing diguanylate cyclase n=1 Tax=Pararobbsia silviterrae TaxID=1792498 RepID=A0A494XUP9_9BURK|nr:sensor domain-containing diguanylate cyclase [Pararobbsia silviterrae]RKP51799.1 sensor domain-containing diguanylate cyclase [Pararobbsia silviterrae]
MIIDSKEAQDDLVRMYRIIDTPPEPNFDRVTKLTANIFGRPVCTLSLVDRDRFWFKSKYGTEATEMPRHMAFCSETIRSEEVFVVHDALADPRFVNAPVVANFPFFRFYAGAPLITPSGACVGSLCILDTAPQSEFAGSDRAILSDMASTVVELLEARARQLELVESNEQIAFLASHDPLTGLANRRRLWEVIDEASTDAQIALLYLDLDGFKVVNDKLGHVLGDVLLRHVADRIRLSLPEKALVARLGGDEFAVLLRKGDGNLLSEAEQVARHLVDVVGRPYELGDYSAEIGVSIGVALVRGDFELDTTLRIADRALYEAKLAGRGCYRVANA